jgi:hypothetical protein
MEVASCGRCVQVGSGWIGWFAFLLVKLLFVSWRDVCFFYFLCREYLVYYFYFSIYLLYCSPSSFLYIFNIFFIQKKRTMTLVSSTLQILWYEYFRHFNMTCNVCKLMQINTNVVSLFCSSSLLFLSILNFYYINVLHFKMNFTICIKRKIISTLNVKCISRLTTYEH